MGLYALIFDKMGRTAKILCSEHRTAYIKKKPSSNLWEHVTDFLQGKTEDVKFGYEFLNQHLVKARRGLQNHQLIGRQQE